MNTLVTLTAEEFSRIHNALCFASNRGLDATVAEIREALASAYQQEKQDFDRKSDHYQTVKNQLNLGSIWSMYEIVDLHQPHPYPSDAFVCYRGGRVPVFGPTWADIYHAADWAILDSGDDHHIFIEGLEFKNGNELHLTTGS